VPLVRNSTKRHLPRLYKRTANGKVTTALADCFGSDVDRIWLISLALRSVRVTAHCAKQKTRFATR
jgi:hypothetical protein